MSVIHTPREPQFDFRLWVFAGALLAALVVFLLRLWYLQVVRSEELSRRAEALRHLSVSKLSPRGLVFDRNGVLLAGVKPEIVLTAIPRTVSRNPWVLDKVARLVGAPVEKLRERVKDASWRPYLPATIHVGAPIEVAARIAEAGEHLPGIGVESQPMRAYADRSAYAHVLGYVWTPSGKDVERLREDGIEPRQFVGKDGVEREYERELMGTPGRETLEIDGRGRPSRILARDNAQPGLRLVLSLDSKLQALANELLSGRRGAAVALIPETGEVLCLVSSPRYDATPFLRGISTGEWTRLLEDRDHPLLNRAISSSYAPGSTFKVVTSMAAQKAGVFSEYARGSCAGYYQVGNRRLKCLGSHGAIGYRSALARSCNAFFAGWGHRAGHDNLVGAALSAGLGQLTGIDIPGERAGVVPTSEWLKRHRKDPRWYPGDSVNMGVGQGEVSVTPIQMACLMALIANEGVSYAPRLARATVPPGPEEKPKLFERRELARVNAPAAFWRALKSAMAEVVESGTARGSAKIPGLVWAGKTGSAEHRKRELTHSWFVGFAPFDRPEIAVAVVVEASGHGSDVAAPIAREIVRRYLSTPSSSESADSKAVAFSPAAAASLGFPSER